MQRNSYVNTSAKPQTLSYILRSIAERKSEEQIAERSDVDTILVKTWIDALKQIGFIVTNHFNELVITPDGENYLKKFG